MTWKYRCSRCRGRNVFKQKLDGWSDEKCHHCQYARFYFDRARQYRDDYCSCSHAFGYHYTHRRGSPRCVHHPDFELNARVFSGESLEHVLEDIALRAICPF